MENDTVLQIIHDVVKATSLNDFRYPDTGKRVINMPYWLDMGDAWEFNFINPNTDAQLLEHNISKGAVYIMKNIHAK